MTSGIESLRDVSLRVKAREGKLLIVWRCPNCGWRNEEEVGGELCCDWELGKCQNPKCRGRGYVTLTLGVYGSYTDQSDVGYSEVDFSDTVTCPTCGNQTPRGYDNCFTCDKRLP